MRSKLLLAALAAAAGTLVASPASAYSFFGGPYGDSPLGFNLSINGLLRAEVAGRVDAPENWNNQGGNPFDRKSLPRQAYLPPGLLMPADQAPYHWSSVPLPNTPETNDANVLVSRGNVVPYQSNNLNYAVLRSDINLTFRFHHGFKLTAKLRALYQPDVYNSFDAASVRNIQGGIATGPHVGPAALYGGTPNFYEYIVDGHKNPVPLSWSGQNYMFYFPALVLEWHH
ncbi:MAG: hypothetical protein L0H29_01730, partial [Sinobacteraceae bacterium]|nr:hypothetical protein [Nevskiaceae bacterium]